MNHQTTPDAEYDLESVKLPRFSGMPLRLFATLLESPLRGLVLPSLFKSAGLTWLRQQQFSEPPTFYPLLHEGVVAAGEGRVPEAEWPGTVAQAEPGFRFASVYDYARAYREGSTTPEDVACRVLTAIEESNSADPPLRAIIAVQVDDVLAQARAAAERIERGQALSILDGVPVAIKDEVDMVPYPTKVGTSFLGTAPATQDSTVVARMRAAGALLVGKANMHEVGVGVTGLNQHHGTVRNPYAPGHYAGGSAGGPASAVASGLCPVGVGADGGGSIRIPSSFCGVVGLKATFGRVSEFGAAPLTWSMAHLGPLAATATDAALAYAVLAGPDPKDQISLRQPPPRLVGWDNLDLSDLTLGVYWPWFRHADADVVSACEAMLGKLEEMGAAVRAVTIPGLEAGRIAHTIAIAAEIAQAQGHDYDEHHRDYGLDVRINLALARQFTARDYVQAQRVRTRMMATFGSVLQEVDAIMTPSTAVVAPPIPQDALPAGDSDLSLLIEIMRFATPANMTGLPAISFPAGYKDGNLPIGLQAIGRPWQEPMLLRLALAAEQVVERKPPQMHYGLLVE